MHLLEITPAPCLVCGRGNVNDDRDPIRFVDFERDINWNDPAIMCEDCIAKAGGMIGMLSMDERAELHQQIQERDEALHDLEAERDSMKRRAKRLGISFVGADA
jgi:hypothetical protein